MIIRNDGMQPWQPRERSEAAPPPAAGGDRFCAATPDELGLMRPLARRERRPGDPLTVPVLGTPMIVMRDGAGELNRLYLPVQRDDEPDALAIVDCGTPRTWLHHGGQGSPWVEDAFDCQLGGQRMRLPGRRVPPFDEAAGLPPVIGAVGNDFLLAAICVLDIATATLSRRQAAEPEFLAWPGLPFEVAGGMIFVDACLEGAVRRVQLDTGAPASILLRLSGDGDDERGEGRDVLGNPLAVWKTRGIFELPNVISRTVPLWKMPEFPHLEAVGTSTGQKLDGMLGLSALGQKRIVLDPLRKRLFLEP